MEDIMRSASGQDEPLLSLLPEGLPTIAEARGRARLATLMTLRWLAIAGQTLAILVVH